MESAPPTSINPLANLRRFARKSDPSVEHCDLCGVSLPADHDHLIEPATRKLTCACIACALLFSNQQNGRYRRVPRTIEVLRDFQLTDGLWESLHLPINLAFFFHSTPAGRVIAVYPSPAGATESLLSLEAWSDLVGANPMLGELQPDVEALLVNRVGPLREYIRVPIDECFKLVGMIRMHWRGLSGGTEVWREITSFFESLKARSISTGAALA